MAGYSNIELADIHYVYGRANGNCREAQRLYQQIYPQRRCPAKNFCSVHRRLRETGSFLPGTVYQKLIEDETETFEHLQSKSKRLDELQKIQDLAQDRSH
ncbi:hypothetical protein X777_00694 [Ooceraea biroi]|uniref:DUF4817 domain-containing protein n=1 Tax=Ooceraea biroi TaxID=2015173 RepID=A0A026WSC4_OOCBI|nr:hypothetical protein X777_00694 [Ooceraea biroi]